MTHNELVQRGAKWLGNNYRSKYRFPIILTDYHCFSVERPDIIGFAHNSSIVIECKISLSDFRADLKKSHRQHINKLGQMRCYLCPVGLIPKESIPEGWGLLYAHNHKISIEIEPPWHTESGIRWAEFHILYSLVRRASIRGYMPELLKPLPQELVVTEGDGETRFVPLPHVIQ
jgi:hypothetical protein